jgi:hypothetical protein
MEKLPVILASNDSNNLKKIMVMVIIMIMIIMIGIMIMIMIIIGGFLLIQVSSERAAEVRVSPKFFEILSNIKN